jgi:hypothetical protein
MYIDSKMEFTLPTILNSTSLAASHDDFIYDAGASKFVFGARSGMVKLWLKATVTADADPTFMANFVASDESDLDPDLGASPLTTDILASTGIISIKSDGSDVLASGDTIEVVVPLQAQRVARRYYGFHVTLGGTNPDLASGNGIAKILMDAQTNQFGARAAAPA